MILLAQKRNTKVILKGLNPSVPRIFKELGILLKIGQGSIVEPLDQALEEAVDYLGDKFLVQRTGA